MGKLIRTLFIGFALIIAVIFLLFNKPINTNDIFSDYINQSQFTIRLTSDDQVVFSGSILVTSNGKSTLTTVNGTVPKVYQVDASMVSVFFQKQSETGWLKVEIIKDGEIIAEDETNIAHGTVSAASH